MSLEEIYTNDEGRVWTEEEANAEYEEFFEDHAPEELQMKVEELTGKEYDDAIRKWISSLPWKECIMCYVEGTAD